LEGKDSENERRKKKTREGKQQSIINKLREGITM